MGKAEARAGFALALTLIIITGVAVLAAGATMIAMNASLIRAHHVREDEMTRAAETALEQARAQINADSELYPDSSYTTLEAGAVVLDEQGAPIPGLLRSTFVGPVGISSGQYGVNGAILAVVQSGPSTIVRRGQIVQESFSKFAYFTDVEGTIAFGGGDQIYGPVHSNDDLEILSSGATFFGPVSTAGEIDGRNYATFREGFTEQDARIPLPEVAELDKLAEQAVDGGTAFSGTGGAPVGRASTRIEFVAIDLNGDGDVRDDNEGFMRLYQSPNSGWVVGANTVDDLQFSRNCGHYHNDGSFVSAQAHGSGGTDNYMAALSSASRRCYLGGAPELTNGFVPNDAFGQWLPWNGVISPLVAFRTDRNYLYPITRPLNPGFKGVVHISGDVAISGVLRGRVTVAATGNIVIADDVTYATDPSVGDCSDILGLFAGGNITVANTPINAPWRRRNQNGQAYFSYDDTTNEFVHGFLLTLNQFAVQDHNSGSTSAEDCQTTNWGRGCLYLTGGIIQRQRGAVGTASGTGYVKRYSYDPCGASAPPPYFPTTGHFSRAGYYEIDPIGFDIAAYFDLLSAGR